MSTGVTLWARSTRSVRHACTRRLCDCRGRGPAHSHRRQIRRLLERNLNDARSGGEEREKNTRRLTRPDGDATAGLPRPEYPTGGRGSTVDRPGRGRRRPRDRSPDGDTDTDGGGTRRPRARRVRCHATAHAHAPVATPPDRSTARSTANATRTHTDPRPGSGCRVRRALATRTAAARSRVGSGLRGSRVCPDSPVRG